MFTRSLIGLKDMKFIGNVCIVNLTFFGADSMHRAGWKLSLSIYVCLELNSILMAGLHGQTGPIARKSQVQFKFVAFL